MSLLCKVRELQDGDALRQIQQLYDVNFPIEFRHFFAEIIEKQHWDALDPDNPHHEEAARQILEFAAAYTEGFDDTFAGRSSERFRAFASCVHL